MYIRHRSVSYRLYPVAAAVEFLHAATADVFCAYFFHQYSTHIPIFPEGALRSRPITLHDPRT